MPLGASRGSRCDGTRRPDGTDANALRRNTRARAYYVRAAGEVVRAVVEGLGVGGGHRSMAKGIIPLKAFREVYGSTNKNQIRSALFDAFIRAIHHADD